MADDRDPDTGRRVTDPKITITDPRRMESSDLHMAVTVLRDLLATSMRDEFQLRYQLATLDRERASAQMELRRIQLEQCSTHLVRESVARVADHAEYNNEIMRGLRKP